MYAAASPKLGAKYYTPESTHAKIGAYRESQHCVSRSLFSSDGSDGLALVSSELGSDLFSSDAFVSLKLSPPKPGSDSLGSEGSDSLECSSSELGSDSVGPHAVLAHRDRFNA